MAGAEPKDNQIGIDNGYIKLDVTGGLAPAPDDCADPAHFGRMVVQEVDVVHGFSCAHVVTNIC